MKIQTRTLKQVLAAATLSMALMLGTTAWAQPPAPPEDGQRGPGVERGHDRGGPGGPRGPRPPKFEELDLDGDGKLSPTEAAEIPPVEHEGFAKFDKDGDGYLTREELPRPPRRGPGGPGGDGPGPDGDGPHGDGPGGPRGPRGPRVEHFDTDGDGKLSPEEAAELRPVEDQGFAKFDKNKDGYLTQDEMPRPPRFEDHDKDGDGKLSPAEAAEIPPVAHQGFEKFDTDGDGYLTREELPRPPHRGPGRPGEHGPGDGPDDRGPGEGRGHGEGRGRGPRPPADDANQ